MERKKSERDKALIAFLLRTNSLPTTAREFGISRERVRQIAFVNRVIWKKYDPDARNTRYLIPLDQRPIISRLAKTMTAKQIAERYGVRISYIRNLASSGWVKGPFKRAVRCTRNRGIKLTHDDVHAIRRLLDMPASERGMTFQQIAERYGVSCGLISHIGSGYSWGHLPRKDGTATGPSRRRWASGRASA